MTELTYTRPFLYPKQEAAFFHGRRFGLTEASTKAGKAQPLDATVYTPFGPRIMSDLKVGDYAIGLDGNATRISGIFPQGIRQTYYVKFSDDVVVECDGEHLWEVHEFNTKPKVVTTNMLLEWNALRLSRTWVPAIQGAAQFASKDVPLDPYLLGFLLGDGGFSQDSVRVSCGDQEILDSIQNMLPMGHRLRPCGGIDYHITAGEAAQELRGSTRHIVQFMRELGLMGLKSDTKFVPRTYIVNSSEIRLSLLQGLMDADGSVNKHGQPVLEQTSPAIAEDVTEIVQSLGGSVLTNMDNSAGYWTEDGRYVTGKPRYRQVIRFQNPEICFRLLRKKTAVREPKKSFNRMFRSVTPARRVECQCIQIDDPRHLYLTNGFIPTHNTVAAISWFIEKSLAGTPGQNFWWVAPVADQAKIAYTRIKNGLTHGTFTARETPTPTITLINGTVMWFKSGDNPNSLYGEDVYAAVVDEASRVKEESWYALRSTLTATQGPVNIIGNVKGRKNWFYAMARRAQSGDHADMNYAKITVLDAIAAGVIRPDEVTSARRDLPEHVFRELYMAEPADDGGNPFGLQHIEACVGCLSDAPPVAFGIDLAKKQDWLVVIGLDADGRVCVFQRWQHVPWRVSIQRIHGIVGEDTPALVDSTGIGDPVLEELQAGHGNFSGYNFSPLSKQRLMEGLAVSIQSHEVTFPAGHIRSELDSFEYELTRTGVRYTAPEGSFDDCVCALALAREQLTSVAPGANMMQYIEERAEASRVLALAPEVDNNRPWRGDSLGAEFVDELSNELTELYEATVKRLSPRAERMCASCGGVVDGQSRVSDGVHIWHPHCAGVGARTREFARERE